MALTPDGTRLLALNSPDASLSVFDVTGAAPVLTAEIPVGLEPVAVRARSNDEIWVVNEVSDSISIVSLNNGSVIDTLPTGDEPADCLKNADFTSSFQIDTDMTNRISQRQDMVAAMEAPLVFTLRRTHDLPAT